MVKYFQIIPSLTDLELYLNPDDDGDNALDPFRTFLKVLGTAENFPTNLLSFTLWACFSERADNVTLISVLTGRRASPHAPLQSFRLMLPFNEAGHDMMVPDRDIIIALQQFGKDGMHIHVGPQMHNFL